MKELVLSPPTSMHYAVQQFSFGLDLIEPLRIKYPCHNMC